LNHSSDDERVYVCGCTNESRADSRWFLCPLVQKYRCSGITLGEVFSSTPIVRIGRAITPQPLKFNGHTRTTWGIARKHVIGRSLTCDVCTCWVDTCH